MLEAQCVCEKKGISVQKYHSALRGNLFSFSCEEAMELQGYRLPLSFLPALENEPVWTVMDCAVGGLNRLSHEA